MPSVSNIMQRLIQQSLSILRDGGTLLYPTDTIWGIGCDASNRNAVEKIYRIKQRDHAKSMLVLARPEWVEQCPSVARPFLDGTTKPTTVILPIDALPLMPELADNLPAADGTIGVRVPRHPFCQSLLEALGHPLVSTSANFSGRPSPQGYSDIDPDIKSLVDYALPGLSSFRSGYTQGSRIVMLKTDGAVQILRD